MGPFLMDKVKWPQLKLPEEIGVQGVEKASQKCITQADQSQGEIVTAH